MAAAVTVNYLPPNFTTHNPAESHFINQSLEQAASVSDSSSTFSPVSSPEFYFEPTSVDSLEVGALAFCLLPVDGPVAQGPESCSLAVTRSYAHSGASVTRDIRCDIISFLGPTLKPGSRRRSGCTFARDHSALRVYG